MPEERNVSQLTGFESFKVAPLGRKFKSGASCHTDIG